MRDKELPELIITGPVPDDLECPVCISLVDDGVCTPCGHWYCRGCISPIHSGSETPVCPTCRSPLPPPSEGLVSLNDAQQRALRKLWAGVRVRCGACSWEGPRGDFLDHGRECGACPVKCPHKGCQWAGVRRELPEHKEVCDFRQLFCECCRASYRWHERAAHEQFVKRCELERRLTAVRYEFSLRLQEQQNEFDRRMKEQADEFERRLFGRKGKGKGPSTIVCFIILCFDSQFSSNQFFNTSIVYLS